MTDLLPCPFCGGRANIYENEVDFVPKWSVGCGDCNADLDVCEDEKQEAAVAWNTRAPQPVSVAQSSPDCGDESQAKEPEADATDLRCGDGAMGSSRHVAGRTATTTSENLDVTAGETAPSSPVAWVVFAENGNVRLWGPDRAGPQAFADARDLKCEPVYRASPAPSSWQSKTLRKLVWLETFTDRGDGSKDQDGWEADSGFGLYYTIEQYFGSDSLGWQVKFDFEVVADCDDPDKAKESAQADFERSALALPSTHGEGGK